MACKDTEQACGDNSRSLARIAWCHSQSTPSAPEENILGAQLFPFVVLVIVPAPGNRKEKSKNLFLSSIFSLCG